MKFDKKQKKSKFCEQLFPDIFIQSKILSGADSHLKIHSCILKVTLFGNRDVLISFNLTNHSKFAS